MHLFLTVTFTTCILLSSIAQAAEPVTKQPQRPSIPQQQGNVQQFSHVSGGKVVTGSTSVFTK